MIIEANNTEASNVGAWIALFQRASTTFSKPLVHPDEYAALVEGTTNLRDKAMFLMLIESGLRAIELVSLDRNMIEYDSRTLPDGSVEMIAVGTVPNAKLKDYRTLPLSDKAVNALRDYLETERRDDDSPVLFANRRGGRIGPVVVRQTVSKACDRLGIVRIGLHEFRRSLAAQFCAEGCDLRMIKAALGSRKTDALIELLPSTKAAAA